MRRLGWVTLLAWVCSAVPLLAATNTNLRGTTQTLITNSTNVANNAGILSGTLTLTSTGYMFADCEFNGPSWSGTVAANSGMSLWLCREVDGSNHEDCDTTNFSPRRPDAFFPLRAANAAQRVMTQVALPPGPFKALFKNDATGVTLNGATTTWTVKCQPWTIQTN